ncbi:DMT family transporter [Roseomonas aerophila]|uniref:DMT family transporter n=1 Tax=Teichococcus aerophilus TaxID=1224513 RepID=A0ABR7RL23_9PROT|nr:DMT family transporter [Pseudoroseomonas aerophila]
MTAPAPLTRSELWLRLVVIAGLWGACFPLLRHVAPLMPPMAVATVRAAFSGSAVILFLLVSGRLRWPRGRAIWGHILVVGTLNGWVPNLLTATAMGGIESAPAALIQSISPLLVGTASLVLFREEVRGRGLFLGLALGLLGIGIILGPRAVSGEAGLGAALMMLATATSYASGTLYVRWVRPEVPEHLVVGQQVVAFAVALPAALLVNGTAAFVQPGDVWLVLLLLGVLGSAVPLSLFIVLLTRAPAAKASLVGYLQPVSAATVAALWLGELPAPHVLAGGAVVLAGVWLATRR